MAVQSRLVEQRNASVTNALIGAAPNAGPLVRCAEIADRIAAEADREGATRAAAILRAFAGVLRADVAAASATVGG